MPHVYSFPVPQRLSTLDGLNARLRAGVDGYLCVTWSAGVLDVTLQARIEDPAAYAAFEERVLRAVGETGNA